MNGFRIVTHNNKLLNGNLIMTFSFTNCAHVKPARITSK